MNRRVISARIGMMRKKLRFASAKILKPIIALILAVVVVVIAWNFLSHSKKRVKVAAVDGKIEQQQVDQKENVIYIQDKKGEVSRRVKAERYYMGSDGLYHLEKNVEITFPGAVEDKDVYFLGDEIVHDQEATYFRLNGNARIKFKDITIKSSYMEYDTKTDFLKSTEGVILESDRFYGEAQRMNCKIRRQLLILQKEVKITFDLDVEPDIPLEITGNRLEYLHKKGQGSLTGKVGLLYGKSRSTADRLEFDLLSEKENFKSLNLNGNVSVTLVAEDPRETSENTDVFFSEATQREILAQDMMIRNFEDSMQVRKMEIRGDCRFNITSAKGETALIQANSMNCFLNEQGQLKRFRAFDSVVLTEADENNNLIRTIRGEDLIMEGKKKSLDVKGKDENKASVQSQDYKISAGNIHIALSEDNMKAEGGVAVVLYPPPEQQNAVGFFSKEDSVLISAAELKYLEENQRFLFNKNVKVWQGKDMLITSVLTLVKSSGKIICSQGVKSIFSIKPNEDSEENTLEIEADSLSFDPEGYFLQYEKKCKLNVKEVSLQGQTIRVNFSEESGEKSNISAYGDVIILQGMSEGRGKEAFYDLEKETVVLVGNPILTEKDKGSSKGDKLTFFLGDGRIVIENNKEKRSKTVIKS